MILLSKEQVIKLHQKLLDRTGGLDGVRDEGLLESALDSTFHTSYDAELYPSTVAKISRVAFSLISNHPFVDGNKHIGTYVMLVLLELNNVSVDFTDSDIINIGLGIANGTMSNSELLNLILEKSN